MNVPIEKTDTGVLRQRVRRGHRLLTLSAPLYVGSAAIIARYAASDFWKPVFAISCFLLLFGLAFGWMVALKHRR